MNNIFNISKIDLILLLVIFQSFGVKIFPYQGFTIALICLIILVLSRNKVIRITKYNLVFASVLILMPLVRAVSDTTINMNLSLIQTSYLLINITNAILLSNYFNREIVESSLMKVLKFYTIHAIIGWILIIIAPNLFVSLSIFENYDDILGVFYKYTRIDGFAGLPRSSGLFWEPGVLQIILNIFLFLIIKNKGSHFYLIITVFAILIAGSTTGYLIMSLQLIPLIITKDRSYYLIIILALLLSVVFNEMYDNIYDKIFGRHKHSGWSRLVDSIGGYRKIIKNPILGNGYKYSDKGYIKKTDFNDDVIYDILEKKDYELHKISYYGRLSTSGLTNVGVIWGVPIMLIYLFKLFNLSLFRFKNKLAKVTVFMILTLSLISEPVSATVFYLIFIFYKSG